jgi:putative transposase
MRYQFIERHRSEYPVVTMCRVLDVTRGSYYAWRVSRPGPREMADQALVPKIRHYFKQSDQTYGSKRIQTDLEEAGIRCGHNRVARLMWQNNLVVKTKRRFKVKTTDSAHKLPVAPNLLNQDFVATERDEIWLTDITYVPTKEGWLYLAAVMDLYSRKVVGWAMSDSLHRQLVIDALQMAVTARKPSPGLLHHSDRGCQYASAEYQTLLTQTRMIGSMSRKGNCYDNAPMESFWGTMKRERIFHRRYATRAEAKSDIFEYIEVFYNRYRRHSALGYKSPVSYEQLPLVA